MNASRPMPPVPGFQNGLERLVEVRFRLQHNVQAGVRVIWVLCNGAEYRTVMPISQVDRFAKIKKMIALKKDPFFSINNNQIPPAVHVDDFDFSFTHTTGGRVTLGVAPSNKEQKDGDWEPSPATFDVLAKRFSNEISELSNYCVCDVEEECEGAIHCPEIKLYLSTLDYNLQKSPGVRNRGPVKPESVVFIDRAAFDLLEERPAPPPRRAPMFLINASCHTRLFDIIADENMFVGRPSRQEFNWGERDRDVVMRGYR